MKQREKNAILEYIREEHHECVIGPENPFSLDNPDALALKNNTLYAIFIPTFTEKGNFDHLLRRLYVSQLSCGTIFVPILLLNEKDVISKFTLYCLDCSFAHISYNTQDVIAYINNGERIFKKWRTLSTIKQNHCRNYLMRMDFAKEEYNRHLQEKNVLLPENTGIHFETLTNIGSWSDQDKSWYTNKYLRSDIGDIAKCRRGKKESFADTFQKVMTMSFKTMYFFSEGYIEMNNNTTSRMRLLDTNWEMFFSDDLTEQIYPNKYSRMLAFVGLTPLQMDSRKGIMYYLDKYQTMYERFFR